MATYEHNALMQYIDKTGNMHINYPATKAENVMLGDSNAQIEIAARAKTSDILYTLEEISACTDFTNKISGAEAVNEVNQTFYEELRILNNKIKIKQVFVSVTTDQNGNTQIFTGTDMMKKILCMFPDYTDNLVFVFFPYYLDGNLYYQVKDINNWIVAANRTLSVLVYYLDYEIA